MKTTNTDAEIKAIVAALAKLHVYPFRQESGDPKRNAQRNLSGKTHYVDDDTLRFHKSRVLKSEVLFEGLLFRITCSDSLDMHNTKRGFRCAVFDVFGTTVSRPDLEHAASTKETAIHRSQNETVDLLAHYREAINSIIYRATEQIAECNAAFAILPTPAPERAAA